MSALQAELRKAVTSKPVLWAMLLGAALPPLVAWLNTSGERRDLLDGAPRSAEELQIFGSGELLLAAAAVAVIGVSTVGAEYKAMPNELGGGRQATTTALAMPSRLRAFGAKLATTALLLAVLSAVSAFAALLVAQLGLGEYALPLDGTRWFQGVRGFCYLMLYGLLSFAVTALVRDGLVPMIYLVCNQTVVSVGYLIARQWHWAWYLPDTAGMAILRTGAYEDPGQPSPLVGLVVASAWVAVLLATAALVQGRRES